MGRPERLEHGPPGTKAPPPEKKAEAPQKEVNANEPKPQAKILDLLEEILPVGIAALLPQQGRPELSEYSETATLGISIGAIKQNSAEINVRDLLTNLGIELPEDADVQDIGQIKKAVAEHIVDNGLPPNLRGLFASLLQADSAFGQANDSLIGYHTADVVETIPEVGDFDQNATTGRVTLSPPKDDILVPEDVNRLGTRPLGAPLTGPEQPGARNSADVALNIDPDVRSVTLSPVREIGTLSLGKPERFRANGLEVAAERLSRNINRIDQEVLNALKIKNIVAEQAAPALIDIEQLAEGMMRANALSKGAPIQPTLSPQLNTDAKADADAESLTATIKINGKPVQIAQGGTTLEFAEQEAESGDAKPFVKAVGDAEDSDFDITEGFSKEDVLNQDTTLEDSLFDEDASTVKQVADVRSTKPTISVSSKVEVAMERVAEVQNKIIEHVQEIAASRGNGRAVIRLNPDDLGTITLAITSFGGKIDTKITASNEHVRHALHVQRPELVQGIESRGLSMSSFTVGQDAGSEAQTQAQSQGHAQHGDTVRQEFVRANNLAGSHSSAPTQAASPSQYVGRSDKAVDYLA